MNRFFRKYTDGFLINGNLLLVCCVAFSCYAHAKISPWFEMSQKSLQENYDRLSPNSLNRYASWKYSQFGEDGIIKEIFRRLDIQKGFFVEFGASDGIFLSNTRKLFEEGWSGVNIESNKQLFKKLQSNYSGIKNIKCLNYFVTFDDNDKSGLSFDKIRKKHFPNQEIDFLSIDIDGCDYYILKSLNCRPKVIMIENNRLWHPLFKEEVPLCIARKNINQPLQVVIDLARKMGYEPVCVTINLFLVRRDLYEPFKNISNDTLTLWRDSFRALPNKEKFVSFKKNNSLFSKYEGEDLNRDHPITVDY